VSWYKVEDGYEDCQGCYATVKEGTLKDVQGGRLCDECHHLNTYGVEAVVA
jgi:hypothetical protein